MIRLPKWVLVVLALVVLLGLSMTIQAAETTKGKIKSVTADKKEFVLTDKDNKDWTFHLDTDAKIRLADKEIKLDELRKDDPVEVKYEKKGDKLMALEIRCERK